MKATMYGVEVIENQTELFNLVVSYYDNGGEPGEEPPEVKDALKKLAQCGPKYRKLEAKTGYMI